MSFSRTRSIFVAVVIILFINYFAVALPLPDNEKDVQFGDDDDLVGQIRYVSTEAHRDQQDTGPRDGGNHIHAGIVLGTVNPGEKDQDRLFWVTLISHNDPKLGGRVGIAAKQYVVGKNGYPGPDDKSKIDIHQLFKIRKSALKPHLKWRIFPDDLRKLRQRFKGENIRVDRGAINQVNNILNPQGRAGGSKGEVKTEETKGKEKATEGGDKRLDLLTSGKWRQKLGQ